MTTLPAGPERAPVYLLRCSAAMARRLEAVERDLASLRSQSADRVGAGQLSRYLDWLRLNPRADPLLLTAVVDEALDLAAMRCVLPPELEALASSEIMVGGGPAEKLASYHAASDPARAARLAALALKKDPRRGTARLLLSQVKAATR